MKYSSWIALVLSILTIQVQAHDITGRIVDCESQMGVSTINIGILDTTIGTISTEKGDFTIRGLKDGSYTLLVSGIGYETKQVPITISGTSQTLTIRLCPTTIGLDEVVVTATRTERLLKDVPIQTQVISSKAIERMQVPNFRNLLEYELPGVDFKNNGGYANINMLGFGGKYVLFLVDGERLAGETFDNIDYNRIDMEQIQQIEIVKGASSSLYGSNAVGGVINIITRKPKAPLEIQSGLRLGSLNEQNYHFNVGTRQKWGYAHLVTSYKSMNPYLLIDKEPLTKEFSNGTKTELPLSQTYISGYTDFHIKPLIGISVSDRFTIELKGGYFFKERNQGGLDGKKVRDRFHDYSGNITIDYQVSEKQNLKFSSNYDTYNKFDYYRLLDEKEKNYENSQWKFTGIHDIKLERKHAIVSGMEFFSDKLMTFMFESDGRSAQKNAWIYSAFSQQEWALHKKITLVTGVRFDYHSQYKGHLTPRISAMYKVGKHLTIRGGYAGGFRSPTLKELYTNWYHPYGGGFQIIGNTNMKAEKSNNLNLSAELTIGKTIITAMGQYSFIDDMVNSVWINNDTVRYINMEKTNALSTELTLTHQIGNRLSIKGSYVYVHNDLGKKSVTRPHSATLRVDYTPRLFEKFNSTFGLSGKYFSSMDIYGNSDLTETDESETDIVQETTEEYKVHYECYAIWRLSFAQDLPFNLSLNAGVHNLFDYKPKFSSFYSSISPGRTIYIGLKWKL